MARELFTSWGDYQSAIDRLLALAEREIRIYDQDMLGLKLDSPSRLEHLKRLLQANRPDTLQVALRDYEPIRRDCPRLMQLLADYNHGMTVQQTPEHLAHLRDAMVLVDGHHGLIRFDRDQPRSKLLIGETEELQPYLKRFGEIWAEGGTPLSITTLGL